MMDLEVSINGGTKNGWFMMENLIEKDDLGVPHSWKSPFGNSQQLLRFFN